MKFLLSRLGGVALIAASVYGLSFLAIDQPNHTPPAAAALHKSLCESNREPEWCW